MDIRIRAAISTAAILAVSIAIGASTAFVVANVSVGTLLNIFIIGFVGYMIYILYSVMLGHLKYKAELEAISKSTKE